MAQNLTIMVSGGAQNLPLLELEGPLPAHPGKYGPGWHLYRFKVVEDGQPPLSGEVHAADNEGFLGVIFRIEKKLRSGNA